MNEKYKIGKKLRDRRLELGLTQKAIAADRLTRNMLSLIESGAASPSIDTLEYLAEALGLPLPYLFSESENISEFLRTSRIKEIRRIFAKGDHKYCIELINELGISDDETELIYATSAFECGRAALAAGSLVSATGYLNDALKHAELTVYPTERIKATAPLYLACASNIQSPLLEFDSERYEALHLSSNDFEFYKYVSVDMNFSYANPLFQKHINAKKLLKRYAYLEAIAILNELEQYKSTNYNAYAFFSIYSDLEGAYKQIGDFENAYRYSSKRMSLLQAFNV